MSSEEKNEDSNTEKHDSEAGAQDSIDATSKEGDGEPEVIIVEEEVEDDSSNTDMVTEIVIESYAEFNDKVDDQTDINRIYSEKIGVESEDPNGHTIVDSGSVKDQVTNDNAESNYHFDDNAMTAEDSKHPGYRDKHSGHHENEDGGGEYQSMPVDEMPDQEAPGSHVCLLYEVVCLSCHASSVQLSIVCFMFENNQIANCQFDQKSLDSMVIDGKLVIKLVSILLMSDYCQCPDILY